MRGRTVFEKYYLEYELWVRVVGHKLPWSRDARIPLSSINILHLTISPTCTNAHQSRYHGENHSSTAYEKLLENLL